MYNLTINSSEQQTTKTSIARLYDKMLTMKNINLLHNFVGRCIFVVTNLILVFSAVSCTAQPETSEKPHDSFHSHTTMKRPIEKSEQQWREQLTPEQYRIVRQKGTERAFTGKYDHFFENGMYACVACKTPLFSSDTKYNSGCGWPAFFDGLEGKIEYAPDSSHGMYRTEILCKACGGHLGHVFEDGPKPTGMRYCVNSESLVFIPAGSSPDSTKSESK